MVFGSSRVSAERGGPRPWCVSESTEQILDDPDLAEMMMKVGMTGMYEDERRALEILREEAASRKKVMNVLPKETQYHPS